MSSREHLYASRPPLLRRLAGEPLVHFLLLGALLFALFAWKGGTGGPTSTRIVITQGLVDHLATGFSRTWRRAPTDAELKGLVDEHVKEEIAQREALALGLDRGDTVIRRRLRQKVEFLLVEEASGAPPTDGQLGEWLRQHPDAFHVEPRVAFRQVLLRPDRRGDAARADAQALLAKLRAAGPEVAIDRLGDSSMLPGEQPLAPLPDVARAFGQEYAQALLRLEPGRWSGPVQSSFGLHVVLVREIAAGAAPTLEQVRPLVEREWLAERRAAQMRTLYDRWLAKYTVTLERPAPGTAQAATVAGNAPQ